MQPMQAPDIEKFIHTVLASLPSQAGPFSRELEQQLRQGLELALNKLDLVTRHEFEIQTGVLQRTRAKLEALEKQLAELETRLMPTDK